MSKYGHRTGNWFEALANKAGGEEQVDAFMRDELILVPRTTKKVWEGDPINVTVGADSSIDFSFHLEHIGVGVADCAKEMLGMKSFMAMNTKEAENLSFVIVDIRALGFNGESPLRSEVYRRAYSFGLDICPAETASRFLLQLTKKLRHGEWFFVASEPIPDANGDASLFMVGCHHFGQPYLGGYSIRDSVLPNNARLAFQIRK